MLSDDPRRTTGAVGFLDDLKRQAEAARAQQTSSAGSQERNSMLADSACNTALRYFTTLAQQLNVLQPASRVTYRLDKRNVCSGMRLCEFKADSRMKKLRGADVYEFVVLRCTAKSGQALRIAKDFPPDAEKLEGRLRQAGVPFEVEQVRNPDTGKYLETRYEFRADFGVSARLTPDHDSGWVGFRLTNLDGFETVTVDFPAIEIGGARLDELARWLVGEPNNFLNGGQNLRRTEV
jgi:hypothetical protein